MEEKKILIVDDKPENLETIVHFLEGSAAPYALLQALDGETAYEIAREELPDLVITDWEMPILDGIGLLNKLKGDQRTYKIPVIMCTGVMTTSEHLNTALEAGANDYIRKPVDKIELFARVRSALLLAESHQTLLQQNKELEALNATKDKFFSIIAHDLRSPFTSLIGFGNLLKNNAAHFTAEEMHEFSGQMYEAILGGFKLLENLLEWASMQTKGIGYMPEPFLLEELLAENEQLFNSRLEAKSLSFTSQCPSGLLVMGDRNMLASMLRNLTSNAIKFTKKSGTIHLAAELTTQGKVRVSVKDSGVGMGPKQLAKLFQIDKNQSTAGTDNEKGTGLGLLLCKEFAECHGTTVAVSSEVGQGSTFWFELERAI